VVAEIGSAVDDALLHWRQGDCAVGEQWFARRVDLSTHVPGVPYDSSNRDVDLEESLVRGFVVVTQTCDIVRTWTRRPFVEVCPLIEVDEDDFRQIEKGWQPGFAVVPLLAAQRLVADLSRAMTVEKPVVAKWPRTLGWSTDVEARAFAASLARKRARFAFPTDFGLFAKKLEDRLVEKHDRQTDEGRALRSLREVRVQASPSWNAAEVALMFWFVRNEENPSFEGRNWSDLLDSWRKLVPASGRFVQVDGQVATLDEMTAADYVFSDPLDLDFLSLG
jgi:hypothetical protein